MKMVQNVTASDGSTPKVVTTYPIKTEIMFKHKVSLVWSKPLVKNKSDRNRLEMLDKVGHNF